MPGKERAIIAVIDSGFDLHHPNLNYVDRSLHFNAEEYEQRRRNRSRPASHQPNYDASYRLRSKPHGTSVAELQRGFSEIPGSMSWTVLPLAFQSCR
ncbi:MAG: hypothetical protein R3A46_12365 [Thermomicrobiales bacterium]